MRSKTDFYGKIRTALPQIRRQVEENADTILSSPYNVALRQRDPETLSETERATLVSLERLEGKRCRASKQE